MNKKDVESIDPLSPQQKGMLFETLFAADSAVHIEQLTWTWQGQLDRTAFQRASQAVAERHSILRTAFVWKQQDEPIQVVVRQVRVPIRFDDWRHLERHEVPEKLAEYLRSDRNEKFELGKPPLIRFAVFQTGETTFEVVSTRHHILMDGWCLPILNREFFQLYEAFKKNEAITLPPSRPYKEYLTWLRQQDISRAEQFWRKALHGFSRPTPLGREEVSEEPSEQRGHAGIAVRMQQGGTERLRECARQHRITLNTVVQGAWAVLLSRYSGLEDVVFGVTVSGRPSELDNVESMVGLFITTLPLRIQVSAGESIWTWLQKLQLRNLEIRDHQYCSTGQVHEWTEVPGSLPLFESIFVYENYPVNFPASTVTDVGVSNVRPMGSRTKYAITLIVMEGSDLQFHIVYDPSRIEHVQAKRILDHMVAVLETISGHPKQEIGQVQRAVRQSDIPIVKVRNRERESEFGFVAPRSETERTLARLWAELLGVKQIGIHENFFDRGGHSMLAVRLFTRIEKVFNKKLPLVTLLQAPTIAKLAKAVSEDQPEQWRSLVPIQPSGEKPPFFCIHAAGGTVLFYRDLARHLGPDQPVYGLQAKGLDGSEPPHKRIEDMAADYIKEMRALQPEGPYFLGGSSFGGVIAYEIARQLDADGLEVGMLALFDTFGPGYPKYPPGTTHFRRKLYQWVIRAELHARSLWIAESGRWPYIAQKSKKAVHMVKRRCTERLRKLLKAIGRPLPEELLRTQFSIREATQNYRIPKYPGKVTLFRATQQIYGIIRDPAMGWDKVVTGELEIHEVPAIHASMVQEPWVGGLVKLFRPCLDRVQSRTSTHSNSGRVPATSTVV